MSTSKNKLKSEEIVIAFGGETEPVVPSVLTTKQAAELLGVKPKTLNEWKNAGLLEGTYRQRRNCDRYWRDRLVACYFNGPEWDETKKKQPPTKTSNSR